jgi:cyclopropane fatty-acyl-phospholipid synthase-like methyltransferase
MRTETDHGAPPRQSLPPDYFEALYARDPDPWRFETSDYERAKYDATLAALPRPRFDRGFEVGCANGVLSRRLAERCGTLLAVDVAEAALARARARCAGMAHVSIQRMRMPAEWPAAQSFDLILLSEVLYYLATDDLERTAKRARAALAAGGAVLLVHYVLPTDYPLSGDAAADQFIAASGFTPVLQRREAAYRLDLLQG